ncbi:Alpha/Beta hydrolase protein [Xylogone sp. PMI_703]|nr:Alpha/Beta hydrolase protein [Xylogone sp. PMI_703]
MSIEEKSPFSIVEHVVPCSYINEYPRATSTGRNETLYISIKQYTPRDNPFPQDGDVTIIATHGCGLPKELYEPLWESIYERSKLNFRIRSIWIADSAAQGASGLLNEERLGNDVSWFDHSRDLLAAINHFRERMPQPLIAIGHSLGAVQLIHLSLMHPRLFCSLIIFEPVMGKSVEDCQGLGFVKQQAFGKDVWASYDEAETSAKKSHKKWDQRVFDRWLKYAYRKLPTQPYSDLLVAADSTSQPVTLATSKHNMLYAYLRPNFDGFIGNVTEKGSTPFTSGLKASEQVKHPKDISVFFSMEPIRTFNDLWYLRPRTLFVFGAASPVSGAEHREDILGRTGMGSGGSGGVPAGNVKEAIIQNAGHFVIMEEVEKCADAAASWIESGSHQWNEEQKQIEQQWRRKDRKDQIEFSEEQLKYIKAKL